MNDLTCQSCGGGEKNQISGSTSIKCPSCKQSYFAWKSICDDCQVCLFCGEKIQCNINNEQNRRRENTNDNSNNTEIQHLNEIIRDLRQKGKQVVASRDKWKRRAEIAESKQNEHFQNEDRKFKQAKKMFSKMYHPDSITGNKFEKLIKQEIFKEFWQVIEDIDKNDI